MEWLEDTLGALAGAHGGASITSTATAMTVVDGSIFQPGHILLIDSEQIWVSAVSTNTLTVTRDFGGTAATHQSDVTVTIIGMARLEGDDSDTIALTDRTTNYNYTQILHKELKVTRTHSQLAQYGISDEMSYQGDKVIPELMRLLERHFYYNAAVGAGSSTTPRVMGGYQAFITDNTLTGGTLTQANVEDAIQLAYEDGGSGPWIGLCAPENYQDIKNFYDTSSFLRIERTENTVGMVVTEIITPFGTVHLVLDRWAKTSEIPLIDVKNAGFKTYYPFTQEALAKDGDYEKSEVVGEFSLCIRQDKSHALITGVT